MLLMTGLITYDGIENPKHTANAAVGIVATLTLAALYNGIAAHMGRAVYMGREEEEECSLPFQEVPVLGIRELEREIGLAG